jgi:virginiamycin B lyase
MQSCSRTVLAVVLAAGGLLAGAGGFSHHARAQAAAGPACPPGCITEYLVRSPDSIPHGIVVGPDGALWFHEGPANKIGRITLTGKITEFSIPTPNCCSQGFLGVGRDHDVWFTEDNVQKIGRITMGGQITEYSAPSPGFQGAITTGPDGAIWLTELGAKKIARRAPDGTFTEYPLTSGPLALIIGPDGALWFTENTGNRVGRITMSGQVTEYPLPTANSIPLRMTVGPDGAIWFTENRANTLGRVTMDGRITEYPVPAGMSPVGITTGPDNAIWFTGFGSNEIGRMALDGTVIRYPIPTANSVPYQITVGPDAALWFTEHGQGPPNRSPAAVHQIGRLQPAETLAWPGVTSSGPGISASFAVSFTSSIPGQGSVYFGSGPGCSGLVEVATQDLHPGTTHHSVVVTGNELPGTVGDNGIQVGTTYWFETVTATSNGTEYDDNGGRCYSVTIPNAEAGP